MLFILYAIRFGNILMSLVRFSYISGIVHFYIRIKSQCAYALAHLYQAGVL